MLNQTHSQPTGMLRGQSSTTLHSAHAAALSLYASATPRLASTMTPATPRSLLPMPLTTALALVPPLRCPCDASDTCLRSLLSATALQHARDASTAPRSLLPTPLRLLWPLRRLCDFPATPLTHVRAASVIPLRTRLQLISYPTDSALRCCCRRCHCYSPIIAAALALELRASHIAITRML